MYTASCLCGGCRMTIDKIIGTGICYCLTCRKMSSSAFTVNALVPSSDFQLVSGTPKTRQYDSDSGATSVMNFCGDCGSALWMDYQPMPDFRILKAGILDGENALELKELQPAVEQYTARRPTWLCPIAGAEQEEGQQGLSRAKEMVDDLEHTK